MYARPVNRLRSVHTNLFFEDFHNRVIPLLPERDSYELIVDGKRSFEFERALKVDDSPRGVDGFVQAIATRLFLDHEVWIEVVLTPASESEPFRVFAVYGVTCDKSGETWQNLPTKDQLPDGYPNDDRWGKSIRLNRANLVKVALPESYTSNDLRKAFEELSKVGFLSTPAWVHESVSMSGRANPSFDHLEATRNERLHALQTVRKFGWPIRDQLLGESRVSGNFFWYWRELRFLLFVSALRERAERALSEVLEIANSKIEKDVSVVAVGVNLPDHVNEIIDQFERGKISLEMIPDVVLENRHIVGPVRRLIWGSQETSNDRV